MSTSTLNRVLDAEPIASLAEYRMLGGGMAVPRAQAIGDEAVLAEIEAAGLRGRGGAGFPTAVKWRTVLDHSSRHLPGTVVVNAAEGEPGSFKDRQLLLTNPYKVLEGAAVAAITVGADTAVIATKAAFGDVVQRIHDAIDEFGQAGLLLGAPDFEVVEGPDDYLYGEETALLEVVEGREPLPRVSPPFRHGLDDVGLSGTSADTELASEGASTDAAPVLVNNVETFAHVSDILARGAGWFRQYGTPEEGGTFVCTVTHDLRSPEVIELPVGSTLQDAASAADGIINPPRAAMIGVSHPIIPRESFGMPLGYGAAPDGIPIGSGSFMFLSEAIDPVAVAAAASEFLSNASCAQCEPCKLDGSALSASLREIAHGTPDQDTVHTVETKVTTVADGARCALARQHRDIVEGLLAQFPESVRARMEVDAPAVQPVEIRPLAGSAEHR